MSFFSEVLVQIGAYLFVFLAALVFFNFLSKGYLSAYLRVKASRGKKVLLRVYSVTGRYYRPALVLENSLRFKNRAKNWLRLTNVTRAAVYDEMGVKCVDYDEETQTLVILDNLEQMDSNDPQKVDDIVTRALQRPILQDKKEVIIIALIIACLIGLAIAIVYLYQIDKAIKGLNIIGAV